MKKRIKKTIALLTLTATLLSTSMTTLAASCLNVRDYGEHRYTQRTYYVVKGRRYVTHTDKVIYLEEIREIWGVCVCGEHEKLNTIYIPCNIPN